MATDTSDKKIPDAVSLLKSDHRQVKEWFQEFEEACSPNVKQKLATNICNALTVHAQIEEEIFYPAFLKATKDKDIHHEAEVEHSCISSSSRTSKTHHQRMITLTPRCMCCQR